MITSCPACDLKWLPEILFHNNHGHWSEDYCPAVPSIFFALCENGYAFAFFQSLGPDSITMSSQSTVFLLFFQDLQMDVYDVHENT